MPATFMIGFSFGIGALLSTQYPNRYMREWVRGSGDVTIEEGGERLVFFVVPAISIDVSPVQWLRIQSSSEVGWAPNTITVRGDDRSDSRSFNLNRYSEVVTANFEYPVNEGKTTNIFFGAGPGIHRVSFEDHAVTHPGFRAQLGMGLLERKIRADGVVVFDYVRASSERQHMWLDGQATRFVLDYTSIHLNAVLHFNLVP
jgi:hypothetical protein